MYDFDKRINRRGTFSVKWNVGENELPMWVADMDFETAPEIIADMRKRLEHGIFGYTDIPDEWYDAYTSWWGRRHGFFMKKDWLMFCTGVVPAISAIVRKLTTPAENVVLMTPVYNIFYNSVLNNGRRVLENRLNYDKASNTYQIDFADLKEKLSDSQTTMLILCNPHNPTGQIWNTEELRRIGELCAENGVTVLSDEIHCDITLPGTSYIPFASVSDICRENSITCIAPTKAFNIAGLQTSAVVVPNRILRCKVNRALNTDEVAEPNVFAITAAIAAFNKGENWLDELNAYIYDNKCEVIKYLAEHIPQLRAVQSDATYLMWVDCSSVTDDSKELAAEIRRKTGLYISAGAQYGGNGNTFIRINTACSRELLYDGLERLKKALN